MMPPSALKCSLLKGTLSETEPGYVFEAVPVVCAQFSADDILRVYNEISEIRCPLVNGLQISAERFVSTKFPGFARNDTSSFLSVKSGDHRSPLQKTIIKVRAFTNTLCFLSC